MIRRVSKKHSKLIIFLLLILVMSVFSISGAAFAEEDTLMYEKLSARIEVLEYARLEGYASSLDYSSISEAVTAAMIETAVEELKLFIGNAMILAIADAQAFDLSIIALPAILELTLEDYEAVSAVRATYEALTIDAKRKTTKLSDLVSLEGQCNTLAADRFVELQSELPDNLPELIEAVVIKVAALREFFDTYMLDGAAELADCSHFIAIENSVKSLQKAQSDSESAAATDALIALISETVTLADTQAAQDARESYQALSDEAKLLVSNYATLTAAETVIDQLTAYVGAAAEFDAMVQAFPVNITYSNKTAVENARTKYNSLPTEAKVFATEYASLALAEARIAELTVAKAIAEEVKASIATLVNVTLVFENRIEEIRVNYDLLGADAKSFVTNYSLLTGAETRIAVLNAAKVTGEAFELRILELPSVVDGIDTDDDASVHNAGRFINEVYEDYNLLTADEKSFVTSYAIIESSLAIVDTIIAAADAAFVIGIFEGLDAVITYDDKPIVESARMAYEALSAESKLLVNNYNKLLNAEAALAAIEKTISDALAVDNKIEAFGAITYAKINNIIAARADYETLSQNSKALVTKLQALLDAEACIPLLLAEKATADTVTVIIENLPANISLADANSVENARTKYNELSASEKLYVTNYTALTAAEDKITLLTQQSQSAEGIIALIANIPEIIDNDNHNEAKVAAQAARTAYNAAATAVKAAVNNYNNLLTAENNINVISKQNQILQVISLIENIPSNEEIARTDRNSVNSARTAYNALDEVQKISVSNYTHLFSAEQKLAELDAYYQEAQDIIELIDALGTVELSKKGQILVLNYDYSKLDEAQKALVTNYNVLTAALNRIAELESAYIEGKTVQFAIVSLTNITLARENDIVAARDAYNALSVDAKTFVTNYSTLTAAENTLTTLKTALTAAQGVMDSIAVLTEITLESEAELNSVNAAYQNLSATAKAMVVNYSVLQNSNKSLLMLKRIVAATAFDVSVDALPQPIAYVDKDAVESARQAYIALSAEEKALTTKLPDLIGAESTLAVIVAEKESAQRVINIINELPEVISLWDKEEVNGARTAYNALSINAKTYVGGEIVSKLTNAENCITLLSGYYNNAMTVFNSIAGIGVVTLQKADTISAVRIAYSALSGVEKIYITNYAILELAEIRIVELTVAQEAAEDITIMINALPLIITLGNAADVSAARFAYNALSNDAKAFVSNYASLVFAEDALITLTRAAMIETAINYIDNIPAIIELEQTVIEAIASARAAYNSLSAESRSAVTNVAKLIIAEEALEVLLDEEQARSVRMLIAGLPERSALVLLNEAEILSVRANYEALSTDGKMLVTNLGELIAIEARMAEMKINKSVAEVWEEQLLTILPISGIVLTQQTIVTQLREAYTNMNSEAKSFVTMLATLEAAEAHLAAENIRVNAAVTAVQTTIAALPSRNDLALVHATAVAGARTQYEALDSVSKAMVNNIGVLIDAELQIYRMQKYSSFNSLVSRIDYRDYEWSIIYGYAAEFIDALFEATTYEQMDSAYAEIMNGVAVLPTALDYNRAQAIAEIENYAEEIGYSGAIDFSAINQAGNVYDISAAADAISTQIAEIRQAQINEATDDTIYAIGAHIMGNVNAYLTHMNIAPSVNFDISEPTATYEQFRVYLAQAYSNEAIEIIILLHKKAVIQLMFAKNETAMEVIGDNCMEEIDAVSTLSNDKAAYDIKQAKKDALDELLKYLAEENKAKYTESNWQTLQVTVIQAMSAIDSAASIEDINTIFESAESAIILVEQGDYNWIILVVAIALGFFTIIIVSLFIIVIIQNKKLTQKPRKVFKHL